jgi:hypothetical protein
MEVTVVFGSVPTQVIGLARGLPGVDGRDLELRRYGSEIQWRPVGGDWATLISVEDLVLGNSVEWSSVLNKPTTFAPSAHTHQIADVSGLQDQLNIFDGGTF